MAVKKKKAEVMEGAPPWMVTYGDMVTLLLTFFVMLLAMSEVKKDENFVDFMQAIREAFGYIGGVRHVPVDEVQVPRNVDLMEMLIIPIYPHDFSQSPDEGIEGEHSSVTNIRKPEVFDVGGKIHFAALSATLDEEQFRKVADFAERMRGYSTQIQVRGHCSLTPVEGTPFADHFELSYARARGVANALIDAGIDPQRIVVVAAGTHEPYTTPAYTAAEHERNDLVQILQINRHVGEF